MTTTRDPGIASPPSNCTCGKPAAITLLKVQHIRSGRMRVGPFSQFGEVQGSKRNLILQPEYRFVTWLAECVDCRYENNQEEMFG